MGDLTEAVKEGLSILIINSIASKNGFLKSIEGDLAWLILKGPLGKGDRLYPIKMHEYSPPSLLLILNNALDSANELGSNLILIGISNPS